MATFLFMGIFHHGMLLKDWIARPSNILLCIAVSCVEIDVLEDIPLRFFCSDFIC